MADEVYMLFEGQCPDCQGEVEAVEANGIREFLNDYQNGLPGKEWDQGTTEKGEIKFRCVNGHENFAFLTFGGDWA